MISLSLKEFALAVGAEPKWVLSVAARLRHRLDYTETDARWLRLARALNRNLRIPLPLAASLAREAVSRRMASAPQFGVEPSGGVDSDPGEPGSGDPMPGLDREPGGNGVLWLAGSKEDGVALAVDLARYESTFQAALAAAKAFGTRRRAGRKPHAAAHYRAALVRAQRKGITVGDLRASMRLPVETRLGGRLPWEILNARNVSPGSGDAAGAAGGWPGARLVETLRHLQQEGVRGVLIGELAEVVRGASRAEPEPCVEFWYDSSPSNLGRLARALRHVGARPAPGARVPDVVTLGAAPNLVLSTRFGALILRADVPGLGDFTRAGRRASIMKVLELDVPVLDVAALREARYASGTRADIQRLPVLDTLIAIPLLDARRRELADQRKAVDQHLKH